MTQFITLTATGRYYAVYVDDIRVSQHTTEREAAEKVTNEKLTDLNADIFYRHEYTVVAELTTAGITLAKDYAPAADQPPTITSTPVVTPFDFGTADSRDLSIYVSDDGLSALTYNLTNVLPNGLSFNQNTGILSYDGFGSGTTSQHQLVATDAVGSDTSVSFDITVYQITVSQDIPPITLIVGGPSYDMSQYIDDPNNKVISSQIIGLNPSLATYDDTPGSETLTGVAEGNMTSLQLEVTY